MTNRREKVLIIKNAFANLIRGSASAIVAIFLPPFLTRSMTPAAFGTWSLVLQLSAYVGYLDFGIQTSISRFVAHASERQDAAQRDRIVSTALAWLSAAGLFGLIGMAVLAYFLPIMFPRIPVQLVYDARAALLLVGGSLSLGLPASVMGGVFVGLQRNEIPALIIGASRLLSAVLVVLVVHQGAGIATMAIITAAVNLVSYIAQYLAYHNVSVTLIPKLHVSLSKVSKAAALELFDYCFSLTIWGIGLLLVTGLDLTIVGFYRFNEVAYYSVAATLVTFLAGMFGALFGAMGAPAAVTHARGDKQALGRLVTVTTRLGTLMLLITGVPLVIFAKDLLRLWVGASYASHTAILLQVLVAANVVRICATPYVLALIGSGEQRRVILVPLLEGIVNVTTSLVLAHFIGALGVALGTLIGSVVGLLGNILYNMRRTREIQMSIREYVIDSLARPFLCLAPVIMAATLWPLLPAGSSRSVCASASLLITMFMLWQVGLVPGERHRITAGIRAGFSSF